MYYKVYHTYTNISVTYRNKINKLFYEQKVHLPNSNCIV